MLIVAYMNPRTQEELKRRRDELLEYLVYTPRHEITERHAYQQQLQAIDAKLSALAKRDEGKRYPAWLRRLLLITDDTRSFN
jgi:hypothetical protein